jgi:hypothetical protein
MSVIGTYFNQPIESGGVHIEGATTVRGDADASRDLFGFEPVDILFRPSDFSLGFQILTKPLCLTRMGRQVDFAVSRQRRSQFRLCAKRVELEAD